MEGAAYTSALIDLSRTSVLAVEDDAAMRAVVRTALGQRGCRDIAQARDGQEALELCRHRHFDLVICDMQMAPMDGPTFLRALRRRATGAHVPVIMLTASDDADNADLARELAVSVWLSKPISAVRLVERVGAVLGMTGAGGDQADVNSELSQLAAQYDARLLADLSALEEIIATLPYRARDRPDAWRALQRILHNLKGQAGTFGYRLVTELAGRGHDLLRAARDNPEVGAREQAEIARAVTSLVTAMRRIARNRLRGNGGEAGVRLLGKFDGFVGPLRARLEQRPAVPPP